MSEYKIAVIVVIGTAMIAVCACSTQGGLPATTPTPTVQPTSTPVSVPPFKPVYVDLDSYETLPGETLHLLLDGLQGEIAEGLSIGVGNTRLADSKWQARMWISNDLCYSAGGRTVYVDDTFEFAGYQIRIADIKDGGIVVAISGQLASPEAIAASCITSPYSRLPGEEVIDIYYERQHSSEAGTIEVGGSHWIEEYTDMNGEVVMEGPAVELKIVPEGQSEAWEGTVHIGETIEVGGYRFRVSTINEVFVSLIWSKVD